MSEPISFKLPKYLELLLLREWKKHEYKEMTEQDFLRAILLKGIEIAEKDQSVDQIVLERAAHGEISCTKTIKVTPAVYEQFNDLRLLDFKYIPSQDKFQEESDQALVRRLFTVALQP